MGAVVSAVRDRLNVADNETTKMAKESLDILEANAEEVLENFRTEVQEKYKNPQEFNKWQVVGGRIDKEDQFVAVATTDKPSKYLTDGVQALAQGLFDIVDGEDDDDTKKNKNAQFRKSATSMISGLFDAFLGSSSAGKQVQKKFLVFPHRFALYRVDVCIYKYNLESQGFKDHYQSQTVVFAAHGILDVKELQRSELLAFASEMFETKEEILQFLKDFKDVLEAAGEITGSFQSRPAAKAALPTLLGRTGAPVLHDQKLGPQQTPTTATSRATEVPVRCQLTDAEKHEILSSMPEKFTFENAPCPMIDGSPTEKVHLSCCGFW